AREESGELIATCGCEVAEAHAIGCGHLMVALLEILDQEIPEPMSHFERESKSKPWKKGYLGS
uniref:hypothetical protein n=1 Tax=Frigidibacter sp. SD6-1 TaxID=3032581 RepID=UPI0024DF709B